VMTTPEISGPTMRAVLAAEQERQGSETDE
jgi:hypothetical protein